MKAASVFAFIALLPPLPHAYGTVREIGGQYAERVVDQKRAAHVAERFFVMRMPLAERKFGRFIAESVIEAKSPLDKGDVLKKGDAIWVVVVIDRATPETARIPVGIVWVRAEDGTVFETGPKG